MTRPQEVSRALVERYPRWLFYYRKENGKPLGAVTQHGRLQRVRSFFHWLTKENYLRFNPASELELPRVPPTPQVDGLSRGDRQC